MTQEYNKLAEPSVKLEGNSHLANQTFDEKTGVIEGFDIQNPNGSSIHVDLTQYNPEKHFWIKPQSVEEMRTDLYSAYQFLVENVPAATPAFESIAKNFPRGISHLKSDHMGAFNDTPGGSSDHINDDPKSRPIRISGNVFLPKLNGYSQPATHYLGVDGKWYSSNPADSLLHEITHSIKELQNWSTEGLAQYDKDLSNKITPENEKRAMAFVDTVLREPRGQVTQDPDSYATKMPENAPRGSHMPLDVEKLRQGPIPKELSEYSHPKVIFSEQQSSLTQQNNAGNQDVWQKLAAFNQHIDALPEHQQHTVRSAMAQHLNKQGFHIEETHPQQVKQQELA